MGPGEEEKEKEKEEEEEEQREQEQEQEQETKAKRSKTNKLPHPTPAKAMPARQPRPPATPPPPELLALAPRRGDAYVQGPGGAEPPPPWRLATAWSPSTATEAPEAKRGPRRPEVYGEAKGSTWSGDAYRVPALAKTMLCVWYAKGFCPRGSDCSYAHGEEELQEVPPHFRYTKSLRKGH